MPLLSTRLASIALGCSFAFLLACTERASGTRDSVAASTGASGAVSSKAVRRGEFVDGDERSTWMLTAAADGGTSIEDNARFGTDGEANRVFTFDRNGALVRATEQRTELALSGDKSPVPMRMEMIIDFRSSTPVATKMVDDIRKDVQPYEIDNLRRRGDVLLKQARR